MLAIILLGEIVLYRRRPQVAITDPARIRFSLIPPLCVWFWLSFLPSPPFSLRLRRVLFISRHSPVFLLPLFCLWETLTLANCLATTIETKTGTRMNMDDRQLMHAARVGDLPLVEQALQNGANVNNNTLRSLEHASSLWPAGAVTLTLLRVF